MSMPRILIAGSFLQETKDGHDPNMTGLMLTHYAATLVAMDLDVVNTSFADTAILHIVDEAEKSDEEKFESLFDAAQWEQRIKSQREIFADFFPEVDVHDERLQISSLLLTHRNRWVGSIYDLQRFVSYGTRIIFTNVYDSINYHQVTNFEGHEHVYLYDCRAGISLPSIPINERVQALANGFNLMINSTIFYEDQSNYWY